MVHRRLRRSRKIRALVRAVAAEQRARERAEKNEARLRVVADELRAANRLLLAVTEGTADAVFVKDRNARYLMMNSAGARVFGMSKEEVIGKTDPELFDSASAREMLERDAAIIASGETVTYEAASDTASGGTRVWLSTKGPYIDREGAVIGLVGVSRDISERKRGEEAQRLLAEASGVLASSLEYEATLDELTRVLTPGFADACLVHVVEPPGDLRLLACTGAPPSMVKGAPPSDDLVESVLRSGRAVTTAQLDRRAVRELLAQGFRSLLMVPILPRAQALGCLSFACRRPGRLEGPGDIALAQELGRRVGLAIDNARLYRAAQDANRLKEEFLSVVSLELRTPLTAVLGWAHILRSEPPSRETLLLPALATIERNAQAQVRLIEDLMDGSAILAGKLHVTLDDVDLSPILESAVEAIRPEAAARQVQLIAALDRSSAPVRGDGGRLRQVVSNLLSNALKFTSKGGTIEVRTWMSSGTAFLRVKDDGEGIAPALLPHVFERFRQGDTSRTRKHGGLGLGLAIARHLVDMHGGTVSAESAGSGRGATFTVRLPLAARSSARPPASQVA